MSLQLSFLFPFGIDLYGKKANIFHVFNQHCNQIEKKRYLCGSKSWQLRACPNYFSTKYFYQHLK